MLLRILRPGAFLLAIMCFTLPFIKISCNGQEVETARGYYMAFGHTKAPAPPKAKTAPSAAPVPGGDNSDFVLQPLILAAFIALGLGFLLAFVHFRFSRLGMFVLAIAAIVSFVWFCIDYKNQLNLNISPTDKIGSKMHITVDFLYGYWLAVGFAAMAGILALFPMADRVAPAIEAVVEEMPDWPDAPL